MRGFVLLLTLLCLLESTAHAQLFGRPRTVGRPLTARVQSQEDVGVLSGNERFLRGNRGRAAFVGADRNEGQTFVGSQQARTSGTIVSSTAGIDPPPDLSRQINQPLTKIAAGQMQLPKISLSLGDLAPRQELSSRSAIISRLQQATSLVPGSDISVSVEGRTAILNGVVHSDEERKLAETLVSFEPGISQIRNLLRSTTAAPTD